MCDEVLAAGMFVHGPYTTPEPKLSLVRNWYCTTVSFVGNALVASAVHARSISPGFVPIVADKPDGAATGVAVCVRVTGRLSPDAEITRICTL